MYCWSKIVSWLHLESLLILFLDGEVYEYSVLKRTERCCIIIKELIEEYTCAKAQLKSGLSQEVE